MNHFWFIFNWVISIWFIVLSFILIRDSFESAFCMFSLSCFLLPPIRVKLFKITSIIIPVKIRFIITGILFIIAILSLSESRQQKEQERLLDLAEHKIELNKQANINKVMTNKIMIKTLEQSEKAIKTFTAH